MTVDHLFLQQQHSIDRVVHDVARRHHLAAIEVDEFRRAVHRAFERHDYEWLRTFDGRSRWETYLRTIITRLFFAFRAELWGGWRPSPAAERLGPTAMLLEELVRRDQLPLAEAIALMRGPHRVDLSSARLTQLAHTLALTAPVGGAAGMADEGPMPDADRAAALADALALLSADDRLLLELRLRDRQPLARIARLLKIELRPLQRRLDRAVAVLRTSLEVQGLPAAAIDEMLAAANGGTDGESRGWYTPLTRPSN